jgi:hypothetical protein
MAPFVDDDREDEMLKIKRKGDKFLRFNVVTFACWTLASVLQLIAGNWYLAIFYVIAGVVYFALTVKQLGHIKYWWRLLQPTYLKVNLRTSRLDPNYNPYGEVINEKEMTEWVKQQFGYNAFYHEHGVFVFRRPKYAVAFKLKWL